MVRSFGSENLSDDSASDGISNYEDVLSDNTVASDSSLNEEVSSKSTSNEEVSNESTLNEDVPNQNASDNKGQSNSELNAGIPIQNTSDSVLNDKLLVNNDKTNAKDLNNIIIIILFLNLMLVR